MGTTWKPKQIRSKHLRAQPKDSEAIWRHLKASKTSYCMGPNLIKSRCSSSLISELGEAKSLKDEDSQVSSQSEVNWRNRRIQDQVYQRRQVQNIPEPNNILKTKFGPLRNPKKLWNFHRILKTYWRRSPQNFRSIGDQMKKIRPKEGCWFHWPNSIEGH